MGSLPYNLRVNVAVPFPALVAGAAGIKVIKTNGIWTIQPDFSTLAPQVPAQAQYPTTFLEIWNSQTGVYSTVSFSTLMGVANALVYTIVTAAGTYNVSLTDTVVLINKTVSAPNTVQLPASATRLGAPVFVKDLKGDASANIITVAAFGAELIDGLASMPINSDYGGLKFWPLLTGGWFLAA